MNKWAYFMHKKSCWSQYFHFHTDIDKDLRDIVREKIKNKSKAETKRKRQQEERLRALHLKHLQESTTTTINNFSGSSTTTLNNYTGSNTNVNCTINNKTYINELRVPSPSKSYNPYRRSAEKPANYDDSHTIKKEVISIYITLCKKSLFLANLIEI